MKYINATNRTEIPVEGSIVFSPDALLGLPANPVPAHVASEATCLPGKEAPEVPELMQVYPNPFSSILNITFSKKVNVILEVTDMLGKVHAVVRSENESSVMLDPGRLNLPDGVYLLRISGDVNATTKVIKAAN